MPVQMQLLNSTRSHIIIHLTAGFGHYILKTAMRNGAFIDRFTKGVVIKANA